MSAAANEKICSTGGHFPRTSATHRNGLANPEYISHKIHHIEGRFSIAFSCIRAYVQCWRELPLSLYLSLTSKICSHFFSLAEATLANNIFHQTTLMLLLSLCLCALHLRPCCMILERNSRFLCCSRLVVPSVSFRGICARVEHDHDMSVIFIPQPLAQNNARFQKPEV